MMLSYMLSESGDELVIVCLEAPDLAHLASDHSIEMPLSDLQRAADEDQVGHLARVQLVLLPPGSTDYLLRRAVEERDRGTDVRIERIDHPGSL